MEPTPATHTIVKFKQYLRREASIVIVITDSRAHDADNHQQTYKWVSNTDTIGS